MDHYSTSAMPTIATTVSEEVARLFQCSLCSDYFLPPIFQCHNGHRIPVCFKCRSEETFCPKCRAPLGNIRILSMENFANTLMFPCKYFIFGCAVSLPHTERREHEETCEFRPYSCPCQSASCEWQGSLEQVMPHLMSHQSIITLQGEYVLFLATGINEQEAKNWVMMQSCFGHHFRLLIVKQVNCNGCQHFYAIVQLIGTRKQAKKFTYMLELNGQKAYVVWEGTTRSIHEPVSTIMNSDCLVFDACTAKLLVDNGKLSILVSISTV